MSELKAYKYDDMIDGDADTSIEYYPKSEADKVIAEKDKEIGVQKRLRDMALASVPNVLKVMKIIQHHKYKRCLAMAMWCHNESMWWYSKGYGFEKYDKFWEKWEKRWLEIADKFKEGV